MGRPIPDDVPLPSYGFDPGEAYLFEIEEANLTESSTNKAMVKLTFRCVEPTPGSVCYENLTIGDEDDLKGEDPQQLLGNNFYRKLIECLRQAKVKVTGTTLEKALAQAIGKRVGIIFRMEKDKRDGSSKARPFKFFAEGAIAPGTDTTATVKAGAAKGTIAPPKPVAKPKAAPVEGDDDEDDEAPPPVKKKAAVKAPPPDDDEDEDD